MLGGDLYVSGNLQVLGSSTNVSLQSSTVDIGDNIILVNAYSPFQRYAGLSAYDSGSSLASGSILWDSETDTWLTNGSTLNKIVGVKGNNSGATAFLKESVSNTSTLSIYQKSGDFILNESFTFDGLSLFTNRNSCVESIGVVCYLFLSRE
jgi:hypothetical protein